MIDFNSLAGGLIGAIIGSIIGAISAFLITRFSINKTFEKSLESYEIISKKEKQKQTKDALEALLIEARENIESVTKWEQDHKKFKFTLEAWGLFKSLVRSFHPSLQEKLVKCYAELVRHNTLIEYDINVLPGSGFYDAQIEITVASAKQVLQELEADLDGFLSVVPPSKSQNKS
ncbi:MAG: hypothetical protein M1444_00365 [Patescibacteria group bacterium]|nr:hypothetical protein [Patescibacteria group bacterium]